MRTTTLAVLVALGGCGDDAAMPADAARDAAADSAPPAHLVAYVSGYGPDIAWFDVDAQTGALAPIASITAFATNPSFLALTPTHLYAAAEAGSRVGAYAIDPATGGLTFLDDVASAGAGPAHVSVDATGAYVLVANYGAGSVAVLPVRGDGGLSAATQTVAAGAQAHQILTDPSNAFVLVPCKGDDWVAQYTFAGGTLTANAVPHAVTADGAGPRHLAFAPGGAHAYLVNELDSTLTAFAFDAATGRLSALHTVSTRAAGATGANTGAEIAVHPSGDFVYASNRGDDDLAVFRIGGDGRVTPVTHVPTGGMTPRMFAIEPSGRWLYAANQGSNNVVVFAIDATTGVPAATGAMVTAMRPSFVGFVALP